MGDHRNTWMCAWQRGGTGLRWAISRAQEASGFKETQHFRYDDMWRQARESFGNFVSVRGFEPSALFGDGEAFAISTGNRASIDEEHIDDVRWTTTSGLLQLWAYWRARRKSSSAKADIELTAESFVRRVVSVEKAGELAEMKATVPEHRLCENGSHDGICSCMRNWTSSTNALIGEVDPQVMILEKFYALHECSHCECAMALLRRMSSGF